MRGECEFEFQFKGHEHNNFARKETLEVRLWANEYNYREQCSIILFILKYRASKNCCSYGVSVAEKALMQWYIRLKNLWTIDFMCLYQTL